MKEQLQHKLYYFEAEPPPGVWDKIASHLDGHTENAFHQKLYNYEAVPPAQVWNNITKELDAQSIPVVPIHRSARRIVRYSASAAVLILAIVLATMLFDKKTMPANTHTMTTVPETNSLPSRPSQPARTEPQTTDSPDTDYKKEGSGMGIARHPKTKYHWNINKVSGLQHNPSASFNKRLVSVVPARQPMVKSDLLERYIFFFKEDGEAVRLSKKIFDYFACTDNEVNCRQKIEIIQQQIASSHAMASADFTGVLDLLHTMNK